MEDGDYNASNWVAHQERIAKGLRSLLSVHEDATLADGMLVQANTTGAQRDGCKR